MATVKPIDHVAILNQAAHFESQMVTAIRTTLKKIAASLDNDSSKITLDDLAIITPLWTAQVDNHLLKQIGQTFTDSANKTRLDQHHALVEILKSNTEALTAATVSPSEGEFEIPKVTNQRAIDLMTNARNRMVNVGNDVWEQARSSLVDGLKAGEGTDKLRDRITESANFSAPRAGVVARTEISHAMNQGTLQQMQQINAPTMTKEWIATDDNRTRPEHAAVNGEKVGINEVFSIGEEPGDAVNCRCTLGFDIPDDDFAGSVCDCEDTPLLASGALVASVSDDIDFSSVCSCSTDVAETALTNDQYDSIIPGSMLDYKEIFNETRQGQSVIDSIDRFTHGSNSGGLRDGIEKAALDKKIDDSVKLKVNDLLGAINGFPSDKIPNELFRGLKIGMNKKDFEIKYAKGKTIDLNISSFTTSKDVAQDFRTSYGGYDFENSTEVNIIVDQAEHALPVERISAFPEQKEWIMGGNFTITSIEKVTDVVLKTIKLKDGKEIKKIGNDYYTIHIKQINSLKGI